ncbi:hypothetical protein EDB83DRAFT_2670046 [Lactarius deliciosus]|nr:hypothetical protein EDB83DRAFT_2670046 [Lactarius deliciosus]
MSSYLPSTASTPTSSGHPLTVSRIEIKDKIFQELKGATFSVDLTTRGAPLQADPDDVQKVFDHLREVTYTTLFSDENSTKDIPRLPYHGFKKAESESYEPLTHLLNSIVNATMCLDRPSYLKNQGLHFHPHGAEMRDKLNSEKPLKPAILGLLDSRTCGTSTESKISWNDVAVIVEVKANQVEVVKQLATYAHSHLGLNRRRSFSIAMSFNQSALTLQFFCFHRSGVSSSPELRLKEEDGFRSVVEHMVGILSIQSEEAFGLDMTRVKYVIHDQETPGPDMVRVKNVYRLNGRNYEIVRKIHERNSIRGHSTAVYSLKAQTTNDTPAGLQSRELERVDGAARFPENLVYKLSYQTEERPSEGTLFSEFFGRFGIVDIVGYHTCSSREPFGTTAHHLSNARFWRLGDDNADAGTPEIRYLHCTAMGLEGLPLLDMSDEEAGIPTPVELMETILHSMIGHYNLFLGGVLHRDISSGNILRLREPVNRSLGPSIHSLCPMLDEDVDLSLCRGFLIDGDHAIEWHKDVRTPLLERSGTLPFVSIRLLYAWFKKRPALHTAADDLESFLWVLVWSLVQIFKERVTGDHSAIHHVWNALSGRSFPELIFKEYLTKCDWSDRVFRGLIQEWLGISGESRTIVNQLQGRLLSQGSDMEEDILDELDEHCRSVYRHFIQAGYRHLEEIEKFPDWNAVVDFNGDELNG